MANEKRLIDANADEGGEVTKIKTHHARIVVDGTADKPYYSIEWYDPIKKEHYLGYSSYYIGNVFHWLSECFEIVDAPTVDAVEVVRCCSCEKHDHDGATGYCNRWEKWTKMSDFCSYGERKDDGTA